MAAAADAPPSPPAVPTLRDVLHSHSDARPAYERFLQHGSSTVKARNAVALLVWLDDQAGGNGSIIRHVPSLTGDAVGHLISEANSVVDRLHQGSLLLPPTPLLSALCPGGGIDPAFFAFNQDAIVHGVAEILDGAGKLIFDDRLYRAFHRHQTGLVGRYPELEEPFVPVQAEVPEDCRAMFVTFSKGQAVDRDDIFDYFRNKWGDCIVRVLMEKTTGGRMLMYGRIIFKSQVFVILVLNGQERTSIFIGEREIWLRKYVPRKNNNNNGGSTSQETTLAGPGDDDNDNDNQGADNDNQGAAN